MGYTTDFSGFMHIHSNNENATTNQNAQFVNEELSIEDAVILINGLCGTRRMKRDLSLIADENGLVLGRPSSAYGTFGEFYWNPESTSFGQDRDPSIIDYNNPPNEYLSLWLKWEVVKLDDGEYLLQWNEAEKFYDYVEWLEFINTKILIPNNLVLNGSIDWCGEDSGDKGTITAINNFITVESF
jgi:hypothetical protein